jgi:hypothetical protein
MTMTKKVAVIQNSQTKGKNQMIVAKLARERMNLPYFFNFNRDRLMDIS